MPLPGPTASVVIPTFRRPEGCTELLWALARQSVAADAFEVLVVDDCSGDATMAILGDLAAELPYRLRVFQTPANLGPGVARNVGWRRATAPVIAFLDDDCLPQPGWLQAGLAYLGDRPRVGVAQGRTTAPDDVDVEALQGSEVWRVINHATPHFDACNIFYRRSALESTGGFDEEIGWWPSYGWPGARPVAWAEDTAAGWAVLEDGWEQGFAGDAVVVHQVESRSLAWHLKFGYLDRAIVALAVAHPGFRREAFWRPWAYRREDAAFALAVAGGLAALKWRPAVLAVLPYLWWRRPSIRKPNFVPTCAAYLAVDVARAAGRLSAAVKYRTLVL
ncbi:MAG: glycosyltransferase family 2 protein [Acidimicrobiales bacterium]